ncbi:MAG: hypothetical protein AB1813_18910 [Verrucomicrobiota bacterium]
MKTCCTPSALALLFLLALAASLTSGCASTDPENASSRPWNTPRSWEHGLPPSIMEGR